MDYKDISHCPVHKTCLDCPTKECVEFSSASHGSQDKERRDKMMITLFNSGKSVIELSRQFQVSERTVQRAINYIKEAKHCGSLRGKN